MHCSMKTYFNRNVHIVHIDYTLLYILWYYVIGTDHLMYYLEVQNTQLPLICGKLCLSGFRQYMVYSNICFKMQYRIVIGL